MNRPSEYVGRVEAVERVGITARVVATLEEVQFTEGAAVKVGDPLYKLDRAPFERADAVPGLQAHERLQAQFRGDVLEPFAVREGGAVRVAEHVVDQRHALVRHVQQQPAAGEQGRHEQDVPAGPGTRRAAGAAVTHR